MGEMMTVNMEKLFFAYILENPEQFDKVDPSNFKKDEIQFVYNIVKEEYLNSKKKQIPSEQQVLAMVESRDTEDKISFKVINSIFLHF